MSLLLSLFFWATACQQGSSSSEAEAAESPDTESTAALNQLTQEEEADGWRLLFDGQSFDGWHTWMRDTVAGWEIEDGTLMALGGEGGDLVSDENFDNFELSFEWKISEGGNSGVMYRVVEDEQYGATYHTGPEYQVIDDEGYTGGLQEGQHTADNYDMHPASSRPVKPVGEFNQSRILVNGSQVEHWLNGEKVVAYELWSDDWEQRVQNAKWKDYPGYGRAESGHIALQDHGDQVWYRNIKIRPL
jgi:hypothetical protein